jgi:hypothetical protein
VAVELRHQVKTRQRAGKLLAQARAQRRFDVVGAGQQAQPQAQAMWSCALARVSVSTGAGRVSSAAAMLPRWLRV